jgi:hypothetical protein
MQKITNILLPCSFVIVQHLHIGQGIKTEEKRHHRFLIRSRWWEEVASTIADYVARVVLLVRYRIRTVEEKQATRLDPDICKVEWMEGWANKYVPSQAYNILNFPTMPGPGGRIPTQREFDVLFRTAFSRFTRHKRVNPQKSWRTASGRHKKWLETGVRSSCEFKACMPFSWTSALCMYVRSCISLVCS